MIRKQKPPFSPFKVIIILLFVFILLDVGLRFLLPSKQDDFNVNRPAEYHELFIPNQLGRLKPDLDETVAFSNATFQVKTNSQGLRSPESILEKPAGVTRIAVLGDSASFGWLMDEPETYPAILLEKLKEHSSKYEVINFSVPGLSSVYANYVYKNIVKNYQPDILVLSLGLYDSKPAKITDANYIAILEQSGFFTSSIIKEMLSRFSSVANWWFSRTKQSALIQLTESQSTAATSAEAKQERVSTQEAKTEFTEIITLHRNAGGSVVLLDANIHNHYFTTMLDELHQTLDTKFFTIYSILSQSGGEEARKLRYEKQLAYPGNTKQDTESISILFRCYAPNHSGLFLRLQAANSSDSRWYDLQDNGKNGDEKAGDKVWSVVVQQEQPADLFYMFYDKKIENDQLPPLELEPFVWIVNKLEQSNGFLTTIPLVINGKLPHQEFRLPENPEYPCKELHRSIANRLYYIITTQLK